MSGEQQYPAVHVFATAFWIVGGAGVVLNAVFGFHTGIAGLFLAGIGGVLNIRGLIRHHHHQIVEMHESQRNAFELGRDVGRDNNVHQIH